MKFDITYLLFSIFIALFALVIAFLACLGQKENANTPDKFSKLTYCNNLTKGRKRFDRAAVL